jgi:hypothetical protein
MVDSMRANVRQQNVLLMHFDVTPLAVGLAGEFINTHPGQYDLENEGVGHL